jgi:hypothetical protein
MPEPIAEGGWTAACFLEEVRPHTQLPVPESENGVVGSAT